MELWLLPNSGMEILRSNGERKQETNLGLELSLFKGRINMEGRYFDEKITDLLDNLKLAPSVGREEATVNVGKCLIADLNTACG